MGKMSPVGTTDSTTRQPNPRFNRPYGTPVTVNFPWLPSDESLGYCQMSLWDKRIIRQRVGRQRCIENEPSRAGLCALPTLVLSRCALTILLPVQTARIWNSPSLHARTSFEIGCRYPKGATAGLPSSVLPERFASHCWTSQQWHPLSNTF